MPADQGQDKKRRSSGRRGGTRPLAASVGGLSKTVLGKRGFAEAGLVTGWENIVGTALAENCWPDRLTFPPGRRDGGTLRIMASGGMALELQHMEPQLLERINSHFGYRAIERMTIIHAPPGRKPAVPGRKPAKQPSRAPAPEARDAVAKALLAVEDPEMRAVLARLGHAVISDPKSDEEKS
jgi:hypothetical protein